MNRGIRIGKLFGINVRVDWSWLLIFALVTWNLATVFSTTHQDWSALLSWTTALVAALLFFLSVLAHEMAHSLVAQARGIPVRGITLFLFGGVSNIQREPSTPGVEFLVAIVGPLTSVVIGVLLVVGAGLIVDVPAGSLGDPTQLVAGMGPVETLMMWLGSVNFLVGLFNMLPAFPLDGGRVLRSIFWAVGDNLRAATKWAARIAQVIAWGMILLGIAMVFGVEVPIFGSGLISGIWLAFIGWFLNSNAVQSYRRMVIHDILEDVPVSRMMRVEPPTIPSGIRVSSLMYDYVMRSDDQAFPVIDDDRLAGLVTLDDVRKVGRENWERTVVDEIMTPASELVTVAPDEDAADALARLQEREFRQLPVLRNGHLEGLLRRRDIMRWLQIESELARS